MLKIKPIVRHLIYSFRALIRFLRYQLTKKRIDDLPSTLTDNRYGDFKERPKFLNFTQKEEVVDFISKFYPIDKSQIIEEADRILKNIFLKCDGQREYLGLDIDWSHKKEDMEDLFFLNRFHFLIPLSKAYTFTGDERYVRKAIELIRDWQYKNPIGKRHVWESYSVAERIYYLIFAREFLKDSYFFLENVEIFLKTLKAHGDYLLKHLEDAGGGNNHLINDGKALFFLGVLYPELKGAGLYQAQGLSILDNEIRRQVYGDGFLREGAVSYQILLARTYCEVLFLARANKIDVSEEMKRKAEKMWEAISEILYPGKEIVYIGDICPDNNDALNLQFFSLASTLFPEREDWGSYETLGEFIAWYLKVEDVIRLYQKKGDAAPHGSSIALFESGYYIMRGWNGNECNKLIFRCDKNYLSVPDWSHAHNDAMSFTISINGIPALIDSGNYRYKHDRWRKYFRGIKAHNCLAIDGVDEFSSGRDGHAVINRWDTSETLDFIEAEHFGFGFKYRRKVLFVKPLYWLLIDICASQNRHLYKEFFHFMPGYKILSENNNRYVRAHHSVKPNFVVHLLSSNLEPTCEILEGGEDGWYALLYGQKMSAPVVRYTFSSDRPVAFAALLYPVHNSTQFPLIASEIEVKDVESYSLFITRAHGVDEAILISNGRPRHIRRFAHYSADGEMVYLRRQGHLERIHLINGGILLDGDKLLVEALPAPPSIDIRYLGEKLELNAKDVGGHFKIFAPTAERVVYNERPVSFRRDHDYVYLYG